MRRAAVLLVGPGVLVGVLALAVFVWDPGPPHAGPCAREPGRPLVSTAREVRAGPTVWTAWLEYPPIAGETTTVLWRAEGAAGSPFDISGRDSEGHLLAVEFGPSPVLPQLGGVGLNWRRGGREWGSRLLFSDPGCWHLDFDLGGRSGRMSVWVVER